MRRIAMRIKTIIVLLIASLSLSAANNAVDSVMLDAYRQEKMSVWKNYLDTTPVNAHRLMYEYGYCGYIVSADKKAALPYVQHFRKHVEALKSRLPKGHFEMYMSAVYVFELRLHESFHPAKGMSLAKEAARLAPKDPLTLTYLGTSLFYAPKPFGSKQEALSYFEQAEALFKAPKWKYCWLREANQMYIRQCHEKLKK